MPALVIQFTVWGAPIRSAFCLSVLCCKTFELLALVHFTGLNVWNCFSLWGSTFMQCVYLVLWTHKVLYGSLYVPYIFLFIHWCNGNRLQITAAGVWQLTWPSENCLQSRTLGLYRYVVKVIPGHCCLKKEMSFWTGQCGRLVFFLWGVKVCSVVWSYFQYL